MDLHVCNWHHHLAKLSLSATGRNEWQTIQMEKIYLLIHLSSWHNTAVPYCTWGFPPILNHSLKKLCTQDIINLLRISLQLKNLHIGIPHLSTSLAWHSCYYAILFSTQYLSPHKYFASLITNKDHCQKSLSPLLAINLLVISITLNYT